MGVTNSTRVPRKGHRGGRARAVVLLTLPLAMLPFATPGIAADPLVSSYVGQRDSEMRGLSAQEIDDLRSGRGMGMARAAELNGFPGPRHVLDAAAAGELHLTPEQRTRIQGVFDRMSAEARRLGAAVLADEQALERAFRGATIGRRDLDARVKRIETLRGQLRAVHLRAHLATRTLLDDHQLGRYEELRGYAAGGHDAAARHDAAGGHATAGGHDAAGSHGVPGGDGHAPRTH